MYSKNIITFITVTMICVEAGVITNAFDPKLEILLSDSNQKLQNFDKLSKFPKKYTGVSPEEYKKDYENTGKSSSSNKSWIEKNILRLTSNSEVSRKVIQNKVFDNDILQSEGKNINNNLKISTTGDKINNQPNNDSVVEYLELNIYPNMIDENFNLSTEGNRHVPHSDDQIHKQQLNNNTDVEFEVDEQYNDNNKENIEDEIAVSQEKTETMSDDQNININMTISTKCADKNVSDDEDNKFDEFIVINNVDDVPEFATEINFDDFEITADLLIDEPRFKRLWATSYEFYLHIPEPLWRIISLGDTTGATPLERQLCQRYSQTNRILGDYDDALKAFVKFSREHHRRRKHAYDVIGT